MNKNSFLQSKLLRSHFALISILVILVGFFVSRAMLSIGMMLFGLNALLGVHPKKWLQQKWWLLGVAWSALYLLSYFWSNDIPYWHTRCEVKLPILLLPLAFAFTPAFNYTQLKIFTITLCALLLFGVGYSLSFLIAQPEFYINGYNYSHVLPTLPKNDHIRFSLAMAAGVIWCVFFFPQIKERWFKIFALISIFIFALALHILAARTGLLALYVFIVGWCCYLAARKKTRIIGIGLLLSFFISGFFAFKYLPTLRQRMGHFSYSVIMFREGNMSGDYSDIGRYMSYDIALKLIKTHPLKGVGAGNILDTMKGGYDQWYPQVPEEQRLIPHNQFLTVGVACGIPALLIFVAWVFFPLWQVKKTRTGFFFVITWCVMLIPLLVEPALETQFGVFVYLFFLLWQRHAMMVQCVNKP